MTSEHSILCLAWFATRSAAAAPRSFSACCQNAAALDALRPILPHASGQRGFPAQAAVSLVENLEELERELTDVEHAMMIRTGEAQVATKETA